MGDDQNPQPLIAALIDMAKWQREQIVKNDKTLDYYTFENGEKHFAQYILEMIGNGWHIEAIKSACLLVQKKIIINE